MGNVVGPLWAECPGFTRIVCAGYPAVAVLSILVNNAGVDVLVQALSFVFECSFSTVFQNYHVWALFTAPFLGSMEGGGMAFLMILFELYMVMLYFPSRERDLGSTTFLAWFLLVAVFINLIYCLVTFAAWKSAGNAFAPLPRIQGLWPVALVCLTAKCLADPAGSQSFWGLAQIPNKWYPLALVGFFCLINKQIMWNFAAALAVGYGYSYMPIERLLPSRVQASAVERRCCCARWRRCFGALWVAAADTAGYETESGDRRYATLSDFGRSGAGGQQLAPTGRETRPAPSTSGGGRSGAFTAFAGSGNRLGGEEEELPSRPLNTLPAPEALEPPAALDAPAVSPSAPGDAGDVQMVESAS